MTSSIRSIEQSTVSGAELSCSITLAPFIRPYILLEDGFTYEKSAIEQWLRAHPNSSPIIGELSSTTLCPNCAVTKNDSICPITREPFQEPYYCLEDGHTYEKEAIISWFDTGVRKSIEEGAPLNLISPMNGNSLNSLTLYPNKIFFGKKIPESQDPLKYKVNVEQRTLEHFKNKGLEDKCIFDEEIRGLITAYTTEEFQKRESLRQQIHERRIRLGLPVQNSFFF